MVSKTIAPAAPNRSTRLAPGMSFAWLRCPKHPWRQASVLVGGGFAPVCFDEDGAPHPVDPADLERAA